MKLLEPEVGLLKKDCLELAMAFDYFIPGSLGYVCVTVIGIRVLKSAVP